MTHFEAFIYGSVQGVTEYLPVSSSAHLLLLPHIFGEQDPGLAFDVILHLGTLMATAVYFFSTWIEILKTPMPKHDPAQLSPDQPIHHVHLSWMHLIVGTLPAVIVGGLFNHWIVDHTRSLVVLWVTIPAFGLFLWWADKVRPAHRKIWEASIGDMLFIGCMQVLALIPGVSRSGSTITAGRLRGFTRGDAARISFLLSMPVTAGAIVYEGRHWREIVESMNSATPLIIACVTALVFGAATIHFLIKWVSRTSYTVFAVYRVILGVAIALFLGRGE